ncbi:MAG: putative sulfate exporter family transporter, partial [Gelidibacter sp.]
VGLGFGMFIKETLETSKEGFNLTFYSIILTITLGIVLTKILKLDRKLGHLITSGTSICGGSAIAAVAPVIKADSKTISLALGVVFLLNSIALLIFPPIGHFFNLTQDQFGLWAAIAIHDTSSVVGAALSYGDEALRIATTVKLSRTLWIIPLSIFSMFLFKSKGQKIKIPYFIILFILAIIINSYEVLPTAITSNIVLISKRLLLVTLFLVGSTISIKDLKQTGFKPLVLALSLWIFISIFSLIYITY